MYGMVNKAVEQMVVTRFGANTWEQIKAVAGVETEAFISNEAYDDSVTYNLVGAASKVLDLPAEVVLEEFGKHWVLKTATEGYGELLDAGGKTLPEFLSNLHHFHARVELIFPALKPPRFHVTDQKADSLILHYETHRPGLQPFVIGLLKGLGERFGVEVFAKLLRGRDDGLDHDEFMVSWAAPGTA